MKDYRKDELKTYVIGNILIIVMFSGLFKIFFSLSDGTIDIISKLLGSALLSSILYIYVLF
ncbi:hypothetical protein DXC08_14665 [Clostridium sp. OM07-9AC]|nr:hypothetical protein DXC08_14665 [Clostridium sp. OM07-9AC]